MAFDDLAKGLAAVCNPMTKDKTTNPGEIAAELETLAGKATPGPWEIEDRGHCLAVYVLDGDADEFGRSRYAGIDVLTLADTAEQEGNAALVVAYRNHHATIIAALRAAGEVERMREALGNIECDAGDAAEDRLLDDDDLRDRFESIKRIARRALAGSAT